MTLRVGPRVFEFGSRGFRLVSDVTDRGYPMPRPYEELNFQQTGSEVDPFTVSRYRQFYKFMRKGARTVLDMGCNTGRGGRVLKTMDHNLVISGLDIIKERLEQLPRDIYENILYVSSIDIPVMDGSFDVVVAGEFLEHLYPNHVDKVLAEMFRVLRVGGQLLLTTPNPGDIKRKLRRQSVLGGAHLSQHYHDTLKMRLRMTGSSSVRILGSGRVSNYIGCRFPFLSIYGSYLATGFKF
jgi:SAM-dependent methyltransferase